MNAGLGWLLIAGQEGRSRVFLKCGLWLVDKVEPVRLVNRRCHFFFLGSSPRVTANIICKQIVMVRESSSANVNVYVFYLTYMCYS